MNNVSLIGRLVKDVELRTTASNKYYARFTIAVDKNLNKEKKAEYEAKGYPTADFIGVIVWGKIAETCNKYLSKGSKVGVSGRLQTSSYVKDDIRRYVTDVLASNVEFLEFRKKDDMNGFEPTDEDIPF